MLTQHTNVNYYARVDKNSRFLTINCLREQYILDAGENSTFCDGQITKIKPRPFEPGFHHHYIHTLISIYIPGLLIFQGFSFGSVFGNNTLTILKAISANSP